MEWPQTDGGEYLNFLMQVNLADLPRPGAGELPDAGMLYFFLEGDEPATDITCRVLCSTGGTAVQQVELPEGATLAHEDYSLMRPHKLTAQAGIDLPLSPEVLWEGTEEEYNRYAALRWAVSGHAKGVSVGGKLLGTANDLIGEPRLNAAIVRSENGIHAERLYDYEWQEKNEAWLMAERENWRLLWTLYSNNAVDITIWDAGFIQVLVRAEDLAARRFSQIYAEVFSS